MAIWLLLCAATAADPSAAWPSFLGAGASPLTAEAIPLRWSPTENIAWRRRLAGKGQSGPVIWDGRIYVSAIEGANKEQCLVFALSLATGEELWRRAVPSSQRSESNYFSSHSAPTPIVDENGVYVFFETGDFVAYSHAGEKRWNRSLTADYGKFQSTTGLSASPVQFRDSVILQVDHEGPSYLIALDKMSGATRWKTERKSGKTYCSPMLLPMEVETQLVCTNDGQIIGYEPITGEVLWEFSDVGGNTTTSPIPFGPGRLLLGASPGMHGEREGDARKSNLALEISKDNGDWKPRVLWRNEKTTPTFASPIAYRGHAYWVNRVGVIHCFDMETGEQRFAERTKQMCWATPVGIGDRIYFFGKDGLTTVLAAGPEFRVLSENQLWDASAGVDPLNSRREQAEKAREATKDSKSGSSGGKGAEGRPLGRPAPGSEEEKELRRQMAGKFPDPIQYGVAIVNGSLIIRTGDLVYCIRDQERN